jgi:predicted ATPase
MNDLAYRARSLGPLSVVDWAIPRGVSVVVGPNRVGKSTLLRVPELVKLANVVGLNEAVKQVFGGVSHLRNWRSAPSADISLGLKCGGVEWEVELQVQGGEVAALPTERLESDGKLILWRSFGSETVEGDGYQFPLRDGLIPSLMAGVAAKYLVEGAEISSRMRKFVPPAFPPVFDDIDSNDIWLFPVALTSRSYRTYDYEIKHLLRFGSLHSSDLELLSTGENVFPLLRNWRDRPDYEDRYEFVLDTMREIFPHLGRVGFEQAGQTVTMNVSDRRWPDGKTVPIARESTGFITALLQLCAVASCSHYGLVTLDEMETSLHPRAIRVLIEAMRSWAAKHEIGIVLATQSETVLDQFRDDPSHVFVLEHDQERSPQALTELFTPEYLSQFSLGDLFAHLEFGGDVPTDS